MLQLSSYWQTGQTVHTDLLPGEHIPDWLRAEKAQRPRAVLRSILGARLPRRLVAELEAALVA